MTIDENKGTDVLHGMLTVGDNYRIVDMDMQLRHGQGLALLMARHFVM